MKSKFDQIIEFFVIKPRVLFLVDAIGALTTFTSLCLISWILNSYLNVPFKELHFMIFYVLCLFIFSTFCSLFIKRYFSLFIKIIAYFNITYCFLTLLILFNHYSQISLVGFIYFSIEIFVISLLVYIELNVSKKLYNQKRYQNYKII